MTARLILEGADLFVVGGGGRILAGPITHAQLADAASMAVHVGVPPSPVIEVILRDIARVIAAKAVEKVMADPAMRAIIEPRKVTARGPASGKGARRRERWRRW